MTSVYLQRILPDLNYELFLPFWEGTKKSELKFPYCTECGLFHWYPQYRCPHCGNNKIEWVKSKGRGNVFTWTVVHKPFLEAYKNWVPYITALIELDDIPGIRFVTSIIEVSPDNISVGMLVSVCYKKINNELFLPIFRPETS